MNARKVFELLNRINHTPSISDSKTNAKIVHVESNNVVITSPDGVKTLV